jgi:uncharacterized protein involved in response to NO
MSGPTSEPGKGIIESEGAAVTIQTAQIMFIAAMVALVITNLISLLPYRRLNAADNKSMKITRIAVSVIALAISVVYAVTGLPTG